MVLPDIDSLMYKIEAENIYEDFYNDKNWTRKLFEIMMFY